MGFILVEIMGMLTPKVSLKLKIRILLLCTLSFRKILTVMTLFLEDKPLAQNLPNIVMFAGSAKAGTNKYLSSESLNLEKMEKIMYIFILILKNFSPVSLTYQMLKLNTKLWCHLGDTDIFLHGITPNFQIQLQEEQAKVLVKRFQLTLSLQIKRQKFH